MRIDHPKKGIGSSKMKLTTHSCRALPVPWLSNIHPPCALVILPAFCQCGRVSGKALPNSPLKHRFTRGSVSTRPWSELGSTPSSAAGHLGNSGYGLLLCNFNIALCILRCGAAACQESLSLHHPPVLLAQFPRLCSMMVLPIGPGHAVGKQPWSSALHLQGML